MKSMKVNKNVTDSKFPKPPKPPDKPLMPYMRYSRKVWEQVKNANPELKLWEVGKIIGQMWRELPEEEKAGFIEEYEQEKVQYNENMKHYHSSPAYQTWLTAKERAEKGLDEPEQYQKPAAVKPLPKPMEDAEDARESYILEDNDDESDSLLTAKHVSMARYQRNHVLMQEIFSSSSLPESRGYVSRHRMHILKRQVDQLIHNQMKLDQHVEDIHSKHKDKVDKIRNDSAYFLKEYKKVCESRPKVTESMFVELIDKARNDLVNEEQNRKLEIEKRRLDLERKEEQRQRLQLERNSAQYSSALSDMMGNNGAGQLSLNQQQAPPPPPVQLMQQQRIPVLPANQQSLQVVHSGNQPVQIIQTPQGPQTVQIIPGHSEDQTQANQQSQLLLQSQSVAPSIGNLTNHRAPLINQTVLPAESLTPSVSQSVESSAVEAAPAQQRSNLPGPQMQIIQGRSQLVNIAPGQQIISSQTSAPQVSQQKMVAANIVSNQQSADSPQCQPTPLVASASQPSGPIVIHHPPPGHQMVESSSHLDQTIVQPGVAVSPATNEASLQILGAPGTSENKKAPAKKKVVRKPPEQDPNKKPPAKKKRPANPKSKAGNPTGQPSNGNSAVSSTSDVQSQQIPQPGAAPHLNQASMPPAHYQQMQMPQPAYQQPMQTVYQAPMPHDMAKSTANAPTPNFTNANASAATAGQGPPPMQHYAPPPSHPPPDSAQMYTPQPGLPPNYMPHYHMNNTQTMPPRAPQPVHQNIAPASQPVSDMQTQPVPPPVQYQQAPHNVYPPQQQPPYYHHPMPPYPVQQQGPGMENAGGIPQWSYPPSGPGYPGQPVYVMQPPAGQAPGQYRTPPPSAQQTNHPNEQTLKPMESVPTLNQQQS